MKKKFIIIFLFCTTFLFSNEQLTQTDEDFALLQEAIEIVASMSDNIANLVLQHKTDTNSPELTKEECLALVQKMTSFVIIILKKQKLKRKSRKIYLYDDKSFQEQLNHIAEGILYKINMG